MFKKLYKPSIHTIVWLLIYMLPFIYMLMIAIVNWGCGIDNYIQLITPTNNTISDNILTLLNYIDLDNNIYIVLTTNISVYFLACTIVHLSIDFISIPINVFMSFMERLSNEK